MEKKKEFKFKKQYKNAKVVKGKLTAKVKRDFREALPLLKKLIKNKYVKEKVKSISL